MQKKLFSSWSALLFIAALVLASVSVIPHIQTADANTSLTVYCEGTAASPSTPMDAVSPGGVEVDESSWDNTYDITFLNGGSDGYCVLDSAISVASVTLGDGAGDNVFLTHAAEDPTGVTITTTGALTINTGSGIDVDEKGCRGGANNSTNGYGPDASTGICTVSTTGYGVSKPTSSGYYTGGAGHGGAGGNSNSGTSGATYDSQTAPVLLGSGGGGSTVVGGDGGGKIRLDVGGTLTVNGTVSASGGVGANNAYGPGAGGSGGSVYITTGSISGSSTISADGGDAGEESYEATRGASGGGGGIVAVNYGSSGGTVLASTTVAGGAKTTISTVAQDGSDGVISLVQTVYLSSINLDNWASYTNDSTPTIAISQSGATPTHVAFSCNNSDWSDWIAYPGDDVLNDSADDFDMTNGVTGCTTAEDNKTVYAKIKDGSSESSVVSDTIGYDITAPTVQYVSSSNENGTYDVGADLAIQVVFTEDIIDTGGAASIELDFDGTDRSATYSSGSATPTLVFTYTVQTGDNKTDLDYTTTLALSNGGDTLTDRAGNTAVLTLPTVGGGWILWLEEKISLYQPTRTQQFQQ